jgi:hypothetical protein
MKFECEHATDVGCMNVFMGGHIHGFLFNGAMPPDMNRRD